MKKEIFLDFACKSFLEELLMIQSEDWREPEEEVAEGEIIVGNMNEGEKNLYTLLMQKKEELMKIDEKVLRKKQISETDKRSLVALVEELMFYLGFLSLSIKKRFPECSKKLFLRKGFYIVTLKNPNPKKQKEFDLDLLTLEKIFKGDIGNISYN